jgi:peptidoglycan/LPS O-acetylase OafA/YrhL
MVEGHTGVGLFFVLSGFILMLIRMNASDISYWGFMRNRFLRIFPLFLVIYFVAISIGRNEFRPADILYVFFSNLGMAPTSNSFITGAAWTISVEFTFYALFPFVAYAATNKGVKYLLQLIFIIILFKIGAFFISESPKHMYYSTILGRIDQFLIGMIAAMLYVHFVGRKWCRHWIWFLLAVTMAWSGVGVMAGLSSYQAKEQHDIFWAI